MKLSIFNKLFKPESNIFKFFVAVIVAIFTTGFLRVHHITYFPEPDGGMYTYLAQLMYSRVSNSHDLPSDLFLALYPLLTSWVFTLDISQYIALRWIDLLVAVTASFLFFNIILNESKHLLFTSVLVGSALLVMNNVDIILFGYRNSIWASYVPLFAALLVWQSIAKADTHKFYLIGALVSLGILFREPFLPFFVLGAISIFIKYGSGPLLKYFLGSALLGLIVLGLVISLREGNLIDFINVYINSNSISGSIYQGKLYDAFIGSGLTFIKLFWFGILFSIISIYITIKLYKSNKNLINLKHFLFWLSVALVPILEPAFKYAAPYHFANCIPGITGLIAVSWNYISLTQSEKIKKNSILITMLICICGVYPKLSASFSSKSMQQKNVVVNTYNALWADPFKDKERIKYSPFLLIADYISQISNNNSTLAVSNYGALMFPLTGLLPPTHKFHNLAWVYSRLNKDKNKMISELIKYQPTIITTVTYNMPHMRELGHDLPEIIEKTNLYDKIANIESPRIAYGNIYRLKTFESE